MDKGEYKKREARDSFFLLGKYNLAETEQGQAKAFVEKFIIDPSWDSTQGTKYIGDIAIAFLTNNVKYNDYIRPICLNSHVNSIDSYIDNGQMATVTGWGTTENSNGRADKAREVVIPMVKTLQCLKSDVAFFWIFSDESSFCGGKKDGKGGKFIEDFHSKRF